MDVLKRASVLVQDPCSRYTRLVELLWGIQLETHKYNSGSNIGMLDPIHSYLHARLDKPWCKIKLHGMVLLIHRFILLWILCYFPTSFRGGIPHYCLESSEPLQIYHEETMNNQPCS